MAKINIENFGGMIPAVDDRLLPQNAAALSENAWLYDGKLRGMRTPRLVYTLADPLTRMVYRIPYGGNLAQNIASSHWLEFIARETTIVRTPVKDAADPTYYFADPFNPPRYNTQTRIEGADPDYILGVPAPTNAPTVTPTGGVSVTTENRAYVYTHVSFLGEEGPPSPPSAVTTGKVDDTWAITLPAVGGDATDRNLTHTNIYRTVTNDQGGADYYFVAQVAIGDASYNDTATSDVVILNSVLISQFFDPPPTGLKGMVSMPNGMVIGWVDNQIWFCEPYRPHAWPATYQIAVDFNIVGIGVVGNTAVICTENCPYNCSGTHPSVMSLTRISALPEPCTSKNSITSTAEGVLYASANGIVMVGPGTQSVFTSSLVTKDQWQKYVNISRLNAAILERAYYCFSGISEGVFQIDAFQNDAFEIIDYTGTMDGAMVELKDTRVAMNKLKTDTPILNVILDPWSNEVLLIKNDAVYHLDTTSRAPEGTYLWRSKVYRMDKDTNFGVFKVFYEVPENVPGAGLTVRVYGAVQGQNNVSLLHTKANPVSGDEYRLPSGKRYNFYQFELEGEMLVTAFQAATTAKELRGI